MRVDLTYFKDTGKYYASGHFGVDDGLSLGDIWDHVKYRNENGGLPGLHNDSKDWTILVEVPKHPHAHPKMIFSSLHLAAQSLADTFLRKLVCDSLAKLFEDEALLDRETVNTGGPVCRGKKSGFGGFPHIPSIDPSEPPEIVLKNIIARANGEAPEPQKIILCQYCCKPFEEHEDEQEVVSEDALPDCKGEKKSFLDYPALFSVRVEHEEHICASCGKLWSDHK